MIEILEGLKSLGNQLKSMNANMKSMDDKMKSMLERVDSMEAEGMPDKLAKISSQVDCVNGHLINIVSSQEENFEKLNACITNMNIPHAHRSPKLVAGNGGQGSVPIIMNPLEDAPDIDAPSCIPGDVVAGDVVERPVAADGVAPVPLSADVVATSIVDVVRVPASGMTNMEAEGEQEAAVVDVPKFADVTGNHLANGKQLICCTKCISLAKMLRFV